MQTYNQKKRRAYHHRVYVKKEYSGDMPHVFWNYPTDFNSNEDSYMTLTMVFKEFIDLNVENSLKIYAVVNKTEGVIKQLSQTFPNDDLTDEMELLVVNFKTQQKHIKMGREHRNEYNNIRIARKYPNLHPKMVTEVARIETHCRQIEGEIHRLNNRVENLNRTLSDNRERIQSLVDGTTFVVPLNDILQDKRSRKKSPRKKSRVQQEQCSQDVVEMSETTDDTTE